jgi:hypothetical protein
MATSAANKSQNAGTERLQMRYCHVEALVGMAIVAITVIGGICCMAFGVPGGKEIVLAVLSFSAGYGIQRSSKRATARRPRR